jgi:hypothetical protein
MKKYNRNRIRKSDLGPGSRPAKHHSKKPFNPEKYGQLWAGIDFQCIHNASPIGQAKGPVIGELSLGGKKFKLTWTECNKLIETLEDAKYKYNIGKRLGM